MFNLTRTELSFLKKLSTPAKIQDCINAIPGNFELNGDTCLSPRRVLRENTAHCMEGAMLAALALRLLGFPPLIIDLRSIPKDFDHVVAVFKIRGRWGAISKTNHAVERYREPIYRDIRELVMSYFHEYFLPNGFKTLRGYSRPFDLSYFDKRGWVTDENDLFYIPAHLDTIKHFQILTPTQRRTLRRADPIEIKAGKIIEWKRKAKNALIQASS